MTVWQPTAQINTLKQRARILQNVRAFFAERSVLEVQVPSITSSSVTEVHIDSIPVDLLSGRHYLHTSPEYPMKRLLAAGLGDCYSLGSVFRQGESGDKHNPEFTMLEWYRLGFTVNELSTEVITLVSEILDCNIEIKQYTYADAVVEFTGIDIFNTSIPEIQNVLKEREVSFPDNLGDDVSTYMDLLVSTLVFPNLSSNDPDTKCVTVINDYPAEQAALAQLTQDSSGCEVAARFEVFVDGLEVANGYHEISDAELLLKRFLRDNERRKKLGKAEMPIDHYLLQAMTIDNESNGLPDCSGVALGVDRLVMLALNKKSIRDVIAFPVDRI